MESVTNANDDLCRRTAVKIAAEQIGIKGKIYNRDNRKIITGRRSF